MALQGDDEIDSLLALMGGEQTASSAAPSSTVGAPVPSNSEGKVKPKRRKKKKGDANTDKKIKREKSTGSRRRKVTFAETRLSQDCFVWPCSSDGGERLLHLRRGLLHDCAGYECSSSERYGAIACKRCGKSAATHELVVNASPGAGEGADHTKQSCHPLSVLSIATAYVASRNVRCCLGEHYPETRSTALLPPLDSNPSPPSMISNSMDVHLGRLLLSVKAMQREISKPTHGGRGKKQNESTSLGLTPAISASDVQLLQEKTTALISAVQDHKAAIDEIIGSRAEVGEKIDDAAINLVEKRLVAMASCDAVYYRCYYAAAVLRDSTDHACDGPATAAMIPHPATYFSCAGLAWNGSAEPLQMYLGGSADDVSDVAAVLDDSTKQLLLKSWGLERRLFSSREVGNGTSDVQNPLLTLWQSRFIETIRHVWCTRYSHVKSPKSLRGVSYQAHNMDRKRASPSDSQELLLKIHETGALSPEVAEWRDSVRDYPANFYAYAAPTTEALDAISNCLKSSDKIEQVLEAGAGTGYWSALLLSHLKRSHENSGKSPPSVVAYDLAPPTLDGGEAASSNEYHGNIPTFMDVHQATTLGEAFKASATSRDVNVALLLCYPPPGSDMAEKALRAYMLNGGDTVIHVGEWQGLTGDASFEALLSQNFSCQEEDVFSLPSWGTDATYLSIWRRRSCAGAGAGGLQVLGNLSFSSAIGYCTALGCANHARRRCRYARSLQYCSLECYERHSSQRRSVLALNMISCDDLKWENGEHFMDLGAISHGETHQERSETRQKKKKRKRR